MAGYTRQSSFADGDTITAALFNNEYNQLVNAFNNSTGHAHDGTAASGPVIGLIGDAGETSPNNKVLIDTTNNHIEFYVEVSSNPVQQIYIGDGVIAPVTDSDVDIGTTSLRFKDAFIDSITTTGNVAVGGNLTVTGTTTFNGGTITMGDAATDNVVFGADVDSNIIPDDDNTYDLGSSSQQWKDIYIDGVAYLDAIDFNGTTITATAAELNIMDGVTSTAAELNILDGVTATAAEINTLDGITSTVAELNILDGVTASATDINLIDGITNGTVIASKAIITDSNKDITGGRNITISGELDAATLDISGDADIDGTLETDALSINGTTVTSTAAELNILDGVTSTAAELNILDGVTSTATELNLLDGVTATTTELNYVDVATAGTVEASKAIVVDSNKDFTGARNITITGELDAATLDVSGDVDIDGTLEADAITVNGTTLAETISDTVGAMVTSNTETGVTVTYDDSDNTLDFVIGTLNQDTTGNSATATALETARTIHGVSFDGTANIDLTEVVQDTVGAMFSSNTESGITVDYQDSDGTIDLTVGTLNQNTTGSAATLTTARTIGGVSFDGSANIVPTTFNAATFSGDVNVDSGVLFVDVSENRIGVNQTSPDVSLDLGANTDSIHVPVGTTAQRPGSPAAGYFRYNSTTGGFEGYTDEWGAIAGGGGNTAPSLNTMTGDGSDTTLTLSTEPVNENATFVTIDGVIQHKDTYAVSGTTLTFSAAPPNGSKVEAITLNATTTTTANILTDADGDTKVQVEESSDEDIIRFDIAGTEQITLADGVLKPTTDNDVDLGTASLKYKNFYAGLVDGENFKINGGQGSDGQVLTSTGSGVAWENASGTTINNNANNRVITGSGTANTLEGETNVIIDGESNIAFGTQKVDPNWSQFFNAISGNYGGHLLFQNNNVPVTALGNNFYVNNSTLKERVLAYPVQQLKMDHQGNFLFESALTGTAGATFSTTEKMRIDNSGNVGIGTSSPDGALHIDNGSSNPILTVHKNSTGVSDAVRIRHGRGLSGFNGKGIRFQRNDGTEVGNVIIGFSSTGYNTSSDYRLKENVNYTWDATTRLKQLKPARFNFKDDTSDLVDGFLAHEVSSIVPNSVTGEKDAVDNKGNPDYQSIDHSKLVPLLVKTIQELEARITTLEG